MKHTPGPWYASYEPEVDCDEMIQTGAHSYAFSGGYSEEDFFTGEIFAVEDGEPVTICTVERERDAELIAAAPEMLEMLLELQECAGYWSEYDVPLGIAEKLDSVIAKATKG